MDKLVVILASIAFLTPCALGIAYAVRQVFELEVPSTGWLVGRCALLAQIIVLGWLTPITGAGFIVTPIGILLLFNLDWPEHWRELAAFTFSMIAAQLLMLLIFMQTGMLNSP